MITTTSSETRHLVDQITQKLENIEQIRVGLKQLDKTNYINQISLSKTKINDIFNNISTILDTKKQTIIKEIENIKSDINQQHIENNDEKQYSLSQNINTSNNAANTDEYYDYVSIWIKNKQALQYMDKNSIKSLEQDIIQHVFGGIDELLNQMLIHPVILDIGHSNKLHEILINYSTNTDDLFANYRTQPNISITNIPDDCLSYIMKFIGPNGRYVIQQCCRLFAIIARKPSSLNNLQTDLELLGMVPQIAQIIQGIQSNDNIKNTQAMQLYAKHMEKFEGEINIFLLRGYWSELWEKFSNVVMKNSGSNLSRKIALKAGVHTMYPVLFKILKSVEMKLDDDEKYETIEDKKNMLSDCSDIIREMGYDYNSIILIQNEETIPLLCGLLKNDVLQFEDAYDKKSVLRNICKAISNIIKFGFIKYNQMFVDYDLINILCNIIGLIEV
eukprot:186660_1